MSIPARRSGDTCSRWVGFELDRQRYALPILQVQEVLASADIEPVPGAPQDVLGVINLRGAIVTVLDLRGRLRLPSRLRDADTRIVIVEHAGEAVGLQVDRIAAVHNLTDATIKRPPAAGAEAPPVSGVVGGDGDLLMLMDVERLLG